MINIDFSSLGNIDFTNRDNLLFFIIVLFLIVVALTVLILLLAKFIIVIRNLIKKIFGITKNKKQVAVVNPTGKFQEHKNIDDFLAPSFKNSSKSPASYNINTPIKEALSDDELKNNIKTVRGIDGIGKSQNIEKNLGKLKDTKNNDAKPGFIENLKNEKSKEKIYSFPSNKVIRSDDNIYVKEKTDNQDKSLGEHKSEGLIGGTKRESYFNNDLSDKSLNLKEQESNKSVIPRKEELNKAIKTNNDSSIFGEGEEILRRKLEYKMRRDPKIWQASRLAGLNLSPTERSKLVKEVFSSDLGQNISKKDLNVTLRKLGRKLIDAKDKPALHEKIRKEIKFFKRIGGVK